MNLFRMYWERTLRKPGAIFLWLLLPFVFMTIYSLSFGGDNQFSVGLAIVDRDSSFVSGFVKNAFGQGPLADLLKIHPAEDLDEVEKLFSSEKASAALEIPAGFGKDLFLSDSTTLTVYRNPRHYIGPQIAEGVVGGLATLGNGVTNLFGEPMGLVQQYMGGDKTPSADEVAGLARTFYALGDQAPNLGAITAIKVSLVEEKTKKPFDFNMASMFFPGLVAFALMSLSLSLEYRFLFDRKYKINHRIAMTPIRPINILLQQRLYTVVFLLVMALGCALLGGLIWRIPPTGILNVCVISFGLILFITGINGLIFGLSSSLKAVSSISSVVLMVLMALGGGFFPIELYPDWAQAVAGKIPTGMANGALTRSLTGRAPEISYLVFYAYCGVFFLLSIFMGRKRIV